MYNNFYTRNNITWAQGMEGDPMAEALDSHIQHEMSELKRKIF